MIFQWRCPWVVQVFHDFPWVFHGFPWVVYDFPSFSMVFHGFPWVSMIFQGFSRVFMAKLIHVAPLGRGSCQAKKAKDAKSATAKAVKAKAVKAKAVKARAGESHVVFETFWDISRHLQTMDFVNRRRRSVWEKWKMRIGIQIQLLKINIRVSKQFMFAAAHGSLTKNRGGRCFWRRVTDGLLPAAIHMQIYPQPRFHCNPANSFDQKTWTYQHHTRAQWRAMPSAAKFLLCDRAEDRLIRFERRNYLLAEDRWCRLQVSNEIKRHHMASLTGSYRISTHMNTYKIIQIYTNIYKYIQIYNNI